MSDNSRYYLKAVQGFDAAVRRTAPDAWSNPSPCPDWTAADVVGHNIGMCDMIAGFATGTGSSAPSDGTPDDPLAAWIASFDAMQAALDTQGALQTVSQTPWGELPVDKFLGFVWVDPLIHTWDLAKATGQEPVMDAAQVERGLKQLIRAGESLVSPGRFEAPLDADDSMTALEQFIATSGRDPRWG